MGYNVPMNLHDSGGLKAYLRDIGRYPLIPHDRTIELFREMRSTSDPARQDQLRRLLVNSNLRLVVSIAKQYKDQGVDMIDLIQEGSVGLMEGVKRFDPDRGFRLSTYASYWIKQAIRRHLTGTEHLAGTRTVRLPSHIVALLPQIRRERRALVDSGVTDVTDDVIAERLNVTPDTVRAALDASGPVYSTSIDETSQSRSGRKGVGSLAKFELAMQNATNYDPVEDDLEEVMFSSQLRSIVRGALGKLTPREEQVIRLRFGLMEDPDGAGFEMTPEERAALDDRVG